MTHHSSRKEKKRKKKRGKKETMKVLNKTKKYFLPYTIEVAETFKEKSDGLLKYETPHAMYFETRWGIHTCGMKFPIDVVVLNDKSVVKKVKRNMESGKFFFWNPLYKKILELPIGSGIEDGDILEIA